MEKFVAKMKRYYHYEQNDGEFEEYCFECSENTTMKDILNWVKKTFPYDSKIPNIQLIRLENDKSVDDELKSREELRKLTDE